MSFLLGSIAIIANIFPVNISGASYAEQFKEFTTTEQDTQIKGLNFYSNVCEEIMESLEMTVTQQYCFQVQDQTTIYNQNRGVNMLEPKLGLSRKFL